MNKDFNFYRCYLERGQAGVGGPGFLAATEVVQAVCNADFQRNGNLLRSFPSSPRCFYKYAKQPKDGMYMLRAVKKNEMTTLDILIDTRLYPCFVMIEIHPDWQDETEEVRDTVEQFINEETNQYNWHVNLREHKTSSTQNIQEFVSALSYMKEQEIAPEKQHGNVQIGQLILKVNGNNYYSDEMYKARPANGSDELQPTDEEVVEKLKPLFFNNEDNVRSFLREIHGMSPNNITDLVNQWVKDKLISDYGNSRKGVLWEILKDAGLYPRTKQNWNRRVY